MKSWLLGMSAVVCTAVFAAPFEPLPKVESPKDNPQTAAKVALGQQLFFDPRISLDGTVSCNSCHNVMGSGTDNRAVSVGVAGQKGGRSAPTVFNSALLSVQFWDGRAPSLEEQAKGPIINAVEMGMTGHDIAVQRLNNIPAYKMAFAKVFGVGDTLNIDNVAKAIAAYERTLVTPNAPYDKFLKGNKRALSPEALRGSKSVVEVGCIACHNGPNYAGPKLPIGVGFYQKFPVYPETDYVEKYQLTKDPGRMEATKKEEDRGQWRVPTWRNVALTAPYFHNGSVKTLDEAVRVMAKTQLNKTLTDEQVKDIVAFLNSLTGEFPKQMMPRLPDTPNTTLVDG